MFIKTQIKKLTEERWNVGFIQNSMNDVINEGAIDVKWITHKLKSSWFADPFILEVTEREIILLVEEFYKPINRGRISKLTIDRNTNALLRSDVILELSTHLSFPVIIRKEDSLQDFINDIDLQTDCSAEPYIYILPENGESGHLCIYKYFPNIDKIICLQSVLDKGVADAVPVKVKDDIYLFCTPSENPNGSLLHIYIWSHNDKKFKFFKEISFKENIARMSGSFFKYKDKLMRPTQECNTQYGHAVTLQETDTTEFTFKEIRRLYSIHPTLNIGSHTFNSYKGVIVTDALGFDRMWIRKILIFFKII